MPVAPPALRLRAGGVQDPVADLDDQLAVLCRRQERRRQQLGARRCRVALGVPAHERLAADRLAAGQRQDRLVGEHQLVLRQRVAQAASRSRRCALSSRRRLLVEHLQAAAAGALGAVHRHVGLAQHRLGVGVGVVGDRRRRRSRASPLRRSRAGTAARARPARARRAPAPRPRSRCSSARITNSSPPRRATVSLSRISSASRSDDGHQQPVADVVAEVVVDRLELVEVDEQHRDHAVAAVQSRQRLARAVHQQQPVRQAGQRVVQRLALQPHPVGHVLGGRVPACRRRGARSTAASATSRRGGGSGW